jgi:hypothetical protein
VGQQALVSTEATVVRKGGPLGRVLEQWIGQPGSKDARGVQHLVEHGEAPRVRLARLPRAAPGC